MVPARCYPDARRPPINVVKADFKILFLKRGESVASKVLFGISQQKAKSFKVYRMRMIEI